MQAKSATYVLVHGAWHGAWCWEKMIPMLEALGHRVIAPDLPRNTALKHISMRDYVEAITELLHSIDEPVKLVGHSLGGLIISQVAEYRPKKIDELIYLAAYIPSNGDSLLSLATSATTHHLAPYLHFDETNNTIDIDKVKAVIRVFSPLCTKADQSLAISRLSTQPMKPFSDTVSLGAAFKAVAKRAIICEHDKAIAAVDQVQMAEKAGAAIQFIPADHSPFYACPDRCVSALL